MKERVLNVFKITSVYVGLIIGAGFASGREVMTFFISYGKFWWVGMVITGVLLSVLGYMIMDIIEKNKIKTYSGFLRTTMGEKTAAITEVISGLFLCVLFFAMIAASGSLLYEAFGISRGVGCGVMCIISFFTFVFGMGAVVKINSVLSPLMVAGTVIVCLSAYFGEHKAVFFMLNKADKLPIMIIFSALIYVSYNIITAVSVFIEGGKLLEKDKYAKLGGVFGGIIMAAMGLLIGVVLFVEKNGAFGVDIPMLAVTGKTNSAVNYIYILVLIGAIITTAVGNGYGAVKWVEDKISVNTIVIEGIICFMAFLFSFVGFSKFTDRIYPLFGFLGLVEIFSIFKYFLRTK